ncbi:MAG: 30S ribosomal protein S1 [Gemmatimonadota bacterium]|nr:MAG: 30S ribosomal protein S1 [Gemmatimonadota bacterium]
MREERSGKTDYVDYDDDQDERPRTPSEPEPPRFVNLADDEDVDFNSPELLELLGLYEETLGDLNEGQIVKGKILSVADKDVLVDIGFKSEGIIALNEFSDPSEVVPGAEVEVYLERMENNDGLVVLSKQRADFLRVWNNIKDAYDEEAVVEGRLVRRIKGGVVVDLFGVDAFLPGSQVALRRVPNLDDLIGQTLEFRVIKLNKRRRNIVVSRRVVLEEERTVKRGALIKELEKGQVRTGQVKNITDFGAFVDLGGIDGLLHITDMSWGRVGHPSEIVSIGDDISVKVLEFDKERERISLGLKQLEAYPWEKVEEKYPVNTRIRGRVVSITDYGAFVELEKGVEGLIHVSEMSWTRHVRHPAKILSINDVIDAVVLKVDQQNEKISLGLKQTEPDPWLQLDDKYPVGSKFGGKVRNLTNFGAFVELEEGIDGLVHISDMSWTKRIRHPNEVVKKGDDVDVVVLNIDKEARRISLGVKQVQDDPWLELSEKYEPGVTTNGRISRVLDRGVVVDLDNDLEGFVPISHMGWDNIASPGDLFQEGDEMPLRVISLDQQQRRIVLSLKDHLAEMGDEDEMNFRAEVQRRAGERAEAAKTAEPEPREVDDIRAGADKLDNSAFEQIEESLGEK